MSYQTTNNLTSFNFHENVTSKYEILTKPFTRSVSDTHQNFLCYNSILHKKKK